MYLEFTSILSRSIGNSLVVNLIKYNLNEQMKKIMEQGKYT